jgi:hypothetical protein
LAKQLLYSVNAVLEQPARHPDNVFVALNALAYAAATVIAGTGDQRAREFFERALADLDPAASGTRFMLASAFITDLSERVGNRVQLLSDALAAYVEATERPFGADIDYGQVVKFYEAEPVGRGRYSLPHVVGAERSVINGNPDQAHISTSMIERQNLTMRMSMRRFTRLTNAFSKKVENLRAAVSLHFAHYNFVRVHRTLRVTPAMGARVSDRLWSPDELGMGQQVRSPLHTIPLLEGQLLQRGLRRRPITAFNRATELKPAKHMSERSMASADRDASAVD